MIIHALTYFLSFLGIWVGSGLAIKSVEQLSKTLRMSSFAISFLVLGFFTSISEFSVGINSVISDEPEIFVGNLIGASIVLFMLIIPLLAIVGKSIHIAPELRGFNLPASLIVVALPVILAMDGKVGKIDSIVSLTLFGFLVVSIETKKGLMQHVQKITQNSGVKVSRELLKIIFGVVVIFVASRFLVEQTHYFSTLLNISPFLISLLLIAIGTNVPELSLVLRSAFIRNHQVAFGDYVGSAVVNTFLLGLLTLVYGKPVILTNSYQVSLFFLVVGLLVFYYFARTKNTISRLEGAVLLGVYLAFLISEVIVHRV